MDNENKTKGGWHHLLVGPDQGEPQAPPYLETRSSSDLWAKYRQSLRDADAARRASSIQMDLEGIPQPEHKGEHYKAGGVETIDFMKAKASPEEFRGYLKLTAIKYLSRINHKPGASPLEDVRKAQWFLNRLEEELSFMEGR